MTNHLKIGIVVESTGLPLRQAIAEAAKMGAVGVQIDAAGDLSPEKLGDTGRREFRNLLRSYGQELTALNCPLRRGLDFAEHLQPRIEHVRKVMQLAFDLGARRVVAPGPKVPEDAASPAAQLLRESMLALGPYGDRIGTFLAFEVGYDPADKLRDYLATFDSGSLKLNYDPANMLVNGHDPLANLMGLKGWIEHVHARDARAATVSRGSQEVALGAGDIDWMAFTATLGVLEYSGFLTVERETGQNRLKDVANGVKFLKRFVSPLG
jgi:L-ribulose-5-phosphate 3-epimerase